jgi:B12 binding domain
VTRTDRPASSSALPSILLAVQGFDTSRVLDVLDAEAERQGLDAVVDEVVFPALRVVGTYWAHGSFSVTHEHLFTAAATRWLYARLVGQPAPATSRQRGRPIVLAAGPDDLHVIGLDCLELLLAARGIRVCNLGGQVPVAALVSTATAVDAVAVVVCSHSGPDATSATASLHAVHAAGIAAYYAGSSFDSPFVRRRIPGAALQDSVADSADLLARLIEGPAPDGAASRVVAPPLRPVGS